MFQYAFGKALAQKHKTELIIDTSRLSNKKLASGSTSRSYELSVFHINAKESKKENIKKIKPVFYRILNGLSFMIGFNGIQTSKYFIEKGFSFNNSIKIIGKNCFLVGYWQSSKYFSGIENLIRKEFEFNNVLNNKNATRAAKIQRENSISLHIRRSDFINNKFHNIHGTCSIHYYKSAIEYLIKKVYNPFFFVFSDDIDWARTALNLNFPNAFVSGNVGEKSYVDMQLMSLCKHNIIANSSFSWWGAWLNTNPDKIVIAPKQWFIDEKMNAQTIDLIPDKWIRL